MSNDIPESNQGSKRLEHQILKHADELLKKDIQFTTLFLKSPDPTFIMNDNTRFILCNSAGLDILGYNQIDLILGKHPVDISPEFQPCGKSSMDKAEEMFDIVRSKGIHRFRWEHSRQNGTNFPVEVTLAKLNIAGEKLYFCTWRDISNRVEMEKRLEATQRLYEQAQAIAHLGHWELDLVGNQLHGSNETFRILGHSPDTKVTYETFLEAVHPDDHEFVKRAYMDSLKNRTHYDIEHRILVKDGSIKWVNEQCKTFYAKDGTPLRSIGTILDITKRKQAKEKLKKSLEDTIQVVALAVESRDPYTAGHQRRVADIAVAIAREMGLDEYTVEGITWGALVHDVGKIQTPAEILSNPSKLSDVEYKLIQEHAMVGYSILKDIEFPWPVADIAHQHHERVDGTGYPQGLKGEEICLEARIVAVADVVEAISSHRPYRAALGIEFAMNEIKDKRGKYYDSSVVDACLNLYAKKKLPCM